MKKLIPVAILVASLLFSAAACGENGGYVNPGDSLGGGGTVQNVPSASVSENAAEAEDTAGDIQAAPEQPGTATPITEACTIEEAGDYAISGTVEGKIEVTATAGVHLYLENAAVSATKKVIEGAGDLTLTLIGENTVENSNADGSNAIDCDGTLTVNGTGSLVVTSTKNGISANAIAVKDATLTVNAAKDGLHAEIGAYDGLTAAPEFSRSGRLGGLGGRKTHSVYAK